MEIINVEFGGTKYPIECRRAFVYTGAVAECPEWFIDKILPRDEPLVNDGDVKVHYNRGQSFVIKGRDGYHIVDKGMLFLDFGNHVYKVITLFLPEWDKLPPKRR